MTMNETKNGSRSSRLKEWVGEEPTGRADTLQPDPVRGIYRSDSSTARELRIIPLAWATRTLWECAMPQEEIRAVLAANDPEIVRRHIELHREWLEERLAEQRRTLARVERLLAREIATRNERLPDGLPRTRSRDQPSDPNRGVRPSPFSPALASSPLREPYPRPANARGKV